MQTPERPSVRGWSGVVGEEMARGVLLVALAIMLTAWCVPSGVAHATVEGTPLSLYRSFRVFGAHVATGNTLMSNTPSQPLVNSILLGESSASLTTIPRNSTIEGAFLFWSGSLQGRPDRTARFELADGFSTNVQADTCFTSPALDGFFYCRSDVTELVVDHPRAQGDFNGLYTVGDITARAGVLDMNGQCIDANCQARYAGWSIVVVYSNELETTQRDIIVYDGFRQLDETPRSAGIDRFTISGFEVANPPQGTFSFFGLEGDALLGVPPQDQDPNPQLRCSDCVDFISFNGTRLQDPNNPPGNIFNSTTPTGGSLGIDIDTFDISELVDAGDNSVAIEVGSGDGRPSAQGGGGESVFLGYTVLSLNRLSPNFRTANTRKTVDPPEAGPGETVFFEVLVTNDGSLGATNVVVTDALDGRFEYIAGSTRVDGAAVPDVGGQSPLQRGLRLGSLTNVGDNSRRVTFRARVAAGVPSGTRIPNRATITANELEDGVITNQVLVTVVAPELGQPTKSARDVNGGDLEPGDVVAYTIFIPNNSGRTASGVRFVDDMPPFVSLQSVSPIGAIDTSDPGGGINGNGRVEISEIVIPAELAGVFINYEVRVDSIEELIDQGVRPEDIDGLPIANQGRVQAEFLLADLLTDNPATRPSPDPTVVRLVSAINFRNSRTFKRVVDVDGGELLPGDTLRYTVSLSNTGNADAEVSFRDSLPPFVEGFTLETPLPEAIFSPAPAGDNATGLLNVRGLSVGGGETVTLSFTVQVRDDAPSEARVQNVAELSVPDAPDQDRDLVSEALTVTSGVSFGQSVKEVVGAPPGGFQPGDTVNYVLTVINSGNRAGEGVVVQDDVALNLTDVAPQDGGVFDAGQRRITWTLGDVGGGEARQLRFSARIVAPLANGTVIRNQGLVRADNVLGATPTDDPTTPTADDSTNIVIRSAPALDSSTKVAVDLNGGTLEPGDAVRYTVTVLNTGRDAARNVLITDEISELLTVTEAGDGGVIGDGRVSWTFIGTPELAEVLPGDSVELSFTATIAAPLDNGTLISNQAQLISDELGSPALTDDPSTPEPNDPTVIEVSAEASLVNSLKEVVDANGGAVQPGDVLTYTITVVNDGSGSARDTVVTDTLSEALVAVTPADGGVFDEVTREIRWALGGPVPAGASATVAFQARVADGTVNGTVISNQASVASRDIPQAVLTDDPRNGVGDDDPTRVTVEARPDFVNSTKFVRNETNPDEGFRPGDTVLYPITVRNSGTQQGTNVQVTDTLPDVFDDIEPLDGGVLAGQTVTWTLPTLAPDAEVTLQVRATLRNPLDDGTEVSNQAFVTSDEVQEGVPTDNPNTPEDDDPVVFTVTSQPVFDGSRKLFVDEDGGAVRPGDAITYTIELINTGTSAGVGVVVSDPIDENLTDIEPLDGGVFDPGTREVVWQAPGTPALANVAPDPNAVVSLRVRARVAGAVDNGTVVSNQATINAPGLEAPALTDDPRTVDFPDPTSFPVVSASDLNDAVKSVLPPDDGQFNPGDAIRYNITFSNQGDAAAVNVVVTDVIDENLIFGAATDGGRFDGLELRWDAATTPALARVEPGESVTFAVDAVLTSPLADGTVVFNQARLTADGFVNPVVTDDPATPELDDPTLLEVTSSPSLATSTKTVRDLDGDGLFEPGDVVEYVITVLNDGDDSASEVRVTDPVDLSALTAVTPLNGGVLRGDTITWDAAGNPALSSVRPGQAGRAVLRFRATIALDALNGVVVSNQATLAAVNADAALSDDPISPRLDDPTDFVITAEARFDGMTKSVLDLDGGAVEAGDRLRYTIEVENIGTQVGRGVVVTDDIDSGLVDVSPESGGVLLGDAVRWTLGDLLPGESATLSFEATVRPGLPDGARVPNQAVLTAVGIPGVPSDDPATGLGDDDATVVIVNARPEFGAFTKTVRDLDGGFLRPGDDVEFTISLRNTGLGSARDVVVRDPVDVSLLTDIVPGQGGRLQAGVVSWSPVEVAELSEIPRGAQINLSLRARVRDEVPNGTIVLNQANLSSALIAQVFSDDPGTDAVADATRVEVRFPEFGPLPKGVVDLDGGLVQAGDVLRYTLRVEARGSEPITDVRVVDPIDEALVDIVPSNGGLFNPQTRELTWSGVTTPALGRVEPGDEVALNFTARIADGAAIGQRILNQAVATSALDPLLNERSDDPANGLGDRDATLIVVEAEPLADLDETEKRVRDLNGGVVEPGDELVYTIVVRNTGRGPAGEVVLVDPTPALTQFVPGSTTVDGRGVDDNGAVSRLVGGLSLGRSLAPGESSTVVFRVRVSDEAPVGAVIANQGNVSDSAGVQALTDDPTTSNVDDATTIVVGGAPNLTGALKTARLVDENENGLLDFGESLEYEIRVPNRGTTVASGVVLRDVLPENVSYRPGFFTVNGGRLTEADDDDAGLVEGNTVTVFLGTLEPGDAPTVRFRVVVQRGQEVVNQGSITGREFPEELTDADGNEGNGNQPTVTPVGAARPSLEIAKSVSDDDGGLVEAGDALTYTITVRNNASVTARDVSLLDLLPEGVAFDETVVTPPGEVNANGSRWSLEGFEVPAGQTVVVALRVSLGAGLAEGVEVCNVATVNAAGLGDLSSEPACVTVGGAVGSGRLGGRVFEETAARDGVFNADSDRPLSDFLVRIYRQSNPSQVLAESVTDADGRYDLPVLTRGEYLLKAFTQPGGGAPVEFARQGELRVSSGSLQEQDVLVDPSGRVYDSVSGELINGAEVQIFYAEDDPDPTRAGRLVPPEDLPENQQGQLTRDGLYKFDVLPGHIYRLEVVSPTQGYVFPSSRVSAQERNWDPGVDPNEVVPNAIPDVNGVQEYFLSFDIRGVDDEVLNNHIPLDPIASLIRLEKRANKRTATVGEIISYTISVSNGSARDLVYDPATRLGGVLITDVIPRGFDYVDGSARLRRLVSGRTVGSDLAEPEGELTLNFGVQPDPDDVGARPTPLSIGAGQTLELQYQLVVGTDAKPGKEAINRATLVSADGNAQLSNTDEARVRVTFDPIFDQGVVLGKVFCDADGDGWQDEGEGGVYRARIYMDNGWYAVTDQAGRFHFQAVDPGNHMLKLDADTLPPGGEPTGSVKRVFYVTRGLPVKVAFGATCPENVVTDVDVNASDALIEEQEKRIRANFVEVSGQLGGEQVSVDGRALTLPGASLAVSVKGRGDKPIVNVEEGRFDKPVVFSPSVSEATQVEGWALQVEVAGESEVVHVIRGGGALPERVVFNGQGPGGQAVLSGPKAYTARLVVKGQGGATAISPPVVFGVSGQDDPLVAEELLNGDLFRARRAEMTDELKDKLRAIAAKLRSGRPYNWEVGVHTDDQQDKPAALQALTESRAASVSAFLRSEFGLPRDAVKARGYGGSQALVPNVNERNIFLNNRVEVRVIDPNPPLKPPKLGAAEGPESGAFVNDKALEVDGEGAFSKQLLKPADGLLVIVVQTPEGGVRSVRVNINDGAVGLETPRLKLPMVSLSGDLNAGTLNFGRQTIKPDLLGVKVTADAGDRVLEGGVIKPAASFSLQSPQGVKVESYVLEVTDPSGISVHREARRTALPPTTRWSGAVDQNRTFLIPGWYQVTLTVYTADGQVGRSEVAVFQLKEPPSPAPRRGRRGRAEPEEQAAAGPPVINRQPAVFVNGSPVKVNPDGGFSTDVAAYTGQKVLVEIVNAKGARALMHLTVPDGYPRPVELEPGNARPVLGVGFDAAPALIDDAPVPDSGGAGGGEAGGEVDAPPSGGDAVKPSGDDGGAGGGDAPPAGDDAPPAGGDDEEEDDIDDGTGRMGPELWRQGPGEDAPELWRQKPGEPAGPELWPGDKRAANPERGSGPVEALPMGTAPHSPLKLDRRPVVRFAQAADDVESDGGEPKARSGGAAGDLSNFGRGELDDALLALDEVNIEKQAMSSPAANLKVNLPAQGTVLRDRELVVSGSTDPANTLTINGQPVEVVDGEFVHYVTLPLGPSEVVVRAQDVDGNVGEVRWPVEVSDKKLFLMAFADAGVALEGAELEGLNEDNSVALDGGTQLYGQGRVYMKGYMSGREFLDNFFEEYRFTGYFDSSRLPEFEAFLVETIDPDTYYPIYGDSAEEVREANARGKLYLMLEADESKLIVGNTRAGIAGVQFFRYDRPIYGARLDFNKSFEEGYKTEVRAFATVDDTLVRHTYNYLQGTGGSLYWLRHGDVVEGSERVTLVIKDEASGVELARVPQVRHADYTIDYRQGRVLFQAPIPSVMRGGYLATRVNTTRQVLDGNPIFVEVSYDYEDETARDDGAWGGQVRQTFADIVHVGGGLVREDRSASGQGDYSLWGVEAGLKHSERSNLVVEVSGSESRDVVSELSRDGGLTFDGFTRRTGAEADGVAWMVAGQLELGEFLYEDAPSEFLWMRGYYQSVDAGFYSNGTITEQGQEKFGGEAIWLINETNTLKLRHDGVFLEADRLDDPNPEVTKEIERQVTTLQHQIRGDKWRLTSEFTHTFYDDAVNVDAYNTDIVGTRFGYDFSKRLSAFVGQQYVIQGDPRLYDDDLDNFQTDLGLALKLTESTSLEAIEQLRWSGENAMSVGLSSQLSPDTDVYIRQRLSTPENAEDGTLRSTVMGGENRFADGSGRLYSEYQIDGGGGQGERNRAIVGVGKGFDLGGGWGLNLAYERSQVYADQVGGDNSRDVLSAGYQFTGLRNLKVSQKFEVRYDNADAEAPQANPCLGQDALVSNPEFCRDNLPGGQDKLQFLTANNLVLTFWEDHNLLARFNFSTTENITLDREEARFMAATFGYALRPVSWDWFNFLVKYTYLQDLRPIDLLNGREERENAHVVSLVPVFDTPIRLQFVEKFAWKRQNVRFDNLPEAQSDTFLAISRVNYHLTDIFDLGVEYRFLHNTLADDLKHGALLEFSYIVKDYARLGVGYNFTSFSDDELSDLNRDVGGFFFRIQGTY